MEEFALNIIHIFQDIDSLSFLSQTYLEDVPKDSYKDSTSDGKRKFLMMVERFTDSNLNTLQMFLNHRRYFNDTCKCNCLFCETIAFDDLPCTLQRLLDEIPITIEKLKQIKDETVKPDEHVYLRRIESFLTKMQEDTKALMENQYSSFYHENCKMK